MRNTFTRHPHESSMSVLKGYSTTYNVEVQNIMNMWLNKPCASETKTNDSKPLLTIKVSSPTTADLEI